MFQFLNANGRLGQAQRLEETIDQPLQPYSTGAELFHASQDVTLLSVHPVAVEYDVNKMAMQELAETNPEAKLAYENARRRGQFARGRPIAQPDQYTTKYKDRHELTTLMADAGEDFSDEIKIPPEGLSLARARVFQKQFEERQQAEMVLANAAPGLSKWVPIAAGSLAEGIKDPINLIPFGGGVGRAAMSVKAGTKLFSVAGMKATVAAGARGAASNMAAVAAIDTMTFPYANRYGAGLGFEQAAIDVTMGGILGGFLGSAGNVIGRWKAASLHQDLLLKAALDDEAGRPIDLARIIENRLEQTKRGNPNWNRGVDTTTAEGRLREFLVTSEQMKARQAEGQAVSILDEVQTARTNIETDIVGLKESALDIRNEMAVHESEISQANRRSADVEIFANDQIREIEVRRDTRMDDARIELDQRIQYIRENESPAMVEQSIAQARNQAEPAIGDIYRQAQWEIEGIRSQARRDLAAQAERRDVARNQLEEVRARHIETIDAIRAQQQEINRIDKRILEIKRSTVAPDAQMTGEVNTKVLGESPEMVQARERIRANQEAAPAEARTGGIAEEPLPPNEVETSYREGLTERLDLSEAQREELRLAMIEHDQAMKQRDALEAAVECITRSGF